MIDIQRHVIDRGELAELLGDVLDPDIGCGSRIFPRFGIGNAFLVLRHHLPP